jgi:hypothetical protein
MQWSEAEKGSEGICLGEGYILAICFHHSVLDAADLYIIQAELANCCREGHNIVRVSPLQSCLLTGRRRMLETTIPSKDIGYPQFQ